MEDEKQRKKRGCAIEKMKFDEDGDIVIKCHDFIKGEDVELILTDADIKRLEKQLDKDYEIRARMRML